MDYSLQIQKILIKCDVAKMPDDKIKLYKEAIQLADSHNDMEWSFDLRKELIGEEKGTSRCVEGMPALTWILEAYEQNPDIFEETEFMLEYKWMLAAACRNVNISEEQLNQIFADYKVRLNRNGYSLHSYYRTLAQLAFMLGKFDDAREHIELREKEEHDDLSFCVACEVNDKAELEFRTGNIEKALVTGADLFSGKLDCKYVPFETCCNSINLLFDEGFTEKAAEFFDKADELLQSMTNETANIGYIGLLIRYLTKIDKNKAWAYFEKYVNWSLNCEDYFDFQFSLSVLPLLSNADLQSMQVSSLQPWHRDDNNYDVKILYDYYHDRAIDLAKRFDSRHSINWFVKQVEGL